jgi:HEAT repeat protein
MLRPEAGVALVRVDPNQADKVVPLLVKDLQAADEKQRQQAVAALGMLGPEAKAAAPELVKALRRRELLEPALLALKSLGRGAVPSLSGLLKDENVEYRRLAVILLYGLGPAARDALPGLIVALSDADSGVRAGAARVIEALGPEAGKAVPALIANLQSYQTEVRRAASMALGHIEAAAKEAREPLVECLTDPDGEVRYAAALSLGRIDPEFREAVPALRDALNDPYPLTRLAAIDSLSKIDPSSTAQTVPILLALSREPEEPGVRFRAMEGVVRLAPQHAKPFVPFLTLELYDLDPAPRLNAGLLLVLLDSEHTLRVVLALAGGLRTPLPEARKLIVQKLAMLGPKAREAVPVIARLLQDGTPGMRDEAIKALRTIDPRAAKRFGVD